MLRKAEVALHKPDLFDLVPQAGQIRADLSQIGGMLSEGDRLDDREHKGTWSGEPHGSNGTGEMIVFSYSPLRP